jgi:hypothetical protein
MVMADCRRLHALQLHNDRFAFRESCPFPSNINLHPVEIDLRLDLHGTMR